MGDRPGEEVSRGPVHVAISSSVRGNSTAFGFSIMITMSFATLVRVDGPPSMAEVLVFGIGAALAVAILEGAVTRGFRERVGTVPPEVAMLGTAMNFASVAAGIGAALLAGELLPGLAAWAVGAFAAAGTYVLTESSEILLAEAIQSARGDPEADKPQG